MATRYPAAFDNFVNPTGVTDLDTSALWTHGQQHSDLNDAVEAMQLRMGIDGVVGASEKRRHAAEHIALNLGDWTSRPSRLWPVANLPLSGYCANSSFVFGIQSSGPVFTAVRLDNGAVSHTYNFGAGTMVQDAWVFGKDLFAVVGGVDLGGGVRQYTLYRSVDNAISWSAVLTPPNQDSYFLHQGISLVTINDTPVLLAAEYNVNGTRTPGGANDSVSVWRSYDNGKTWAVVFTWNVGYHEIRHFHAVAQDPTTGLVFFCCGDDNESRIVTWDGLSSSPALPSVANLAAADGWNAIGGAQTQRFVGIAFKDDYFYGMVDSFAAQSGIWRGLCADLSNYARVSTGPKYDSICANNNGWYGFTAPNGDIYFCTQPTAVSTARQSVVYGSRNGENWYAVAQYRCLANGIACIPRSFNVIPDGRVMMSVDYATGRTEKQTIILEQSDMDFIEDRPDVVSPVWFVDPVSGNDTSGTGDFQTPWKTVNRAITGNRITTGARLIVTKEGTFDEVAANLSWAAHATNPGEANQIVCISGVSKTGTILNYITPTAGGPIWRPDATMPLELEHLTCRIAESGTAASWAFTTTTTGDFRVKDAILEAFDNGSLSGPGIYARGGVITGIRSKFSVPAEKAGYSLIASQAGALPANSACNLSFCILDGGVGSVKTTNAWLANLNNVTALHYGAEGALTLSTSASVNSTAHSCAFLSEKNEPGRDLAGRTWAGTEITYCASEISPTAYPAPFVSATNHLTVGLIADSYGRPQSMSSPLMRLGAIPDVGLWDYDRNPVTANLCGAMNPA